jgi:hypothetical protein
MVKALEKHDKTKPWYDIGSRHRDRLRTRAWFRKEVEVAERATDLIVQTMKCPSSQNMMGGNFPSSWLEFDIRKGEGDSLKVPVSLL